MDIYNKPQGYTNSENTHQNPVSHTPLPKTINDKKDTTLLQIAMKAFLKERIYGRIQNFNKFNINNKNHLTERQQRLKSKQRAGIIYSSLEKQIKNQKTKNHKRTYSTLNKTQKLQKIQIESLNELKMKQYLRNMQINIINHKRSKQVRTQRYNQNNNGSQINANNRYKCYENELFQNSKIDQGTSFISAVDIQNFQNKKINLPQISNKRIIKLQSNKKQQKIISNRLENIIRVSFDDRLWQFISRKNVIKQQKKLSNINKDMNNSITSINNQKKFQSFNEKDLLQSKNNIIAKKLTLINKQNFIDFTKNINFNIPHFFQTVSNFFDLSVKIIDKMKKKDFQDIISSIIMQSSRAWAVAIFRYLDQNHDGKIDSSDLFKIYNYLDEILLQAQNFIKSTQKKAIDKKTELENVQNKQVLKNYKMREKTQLSEISNNSKRQRKVSISSKKGLQQTNYDQNQLVIQYVQKNIKNILLFKKQIQKLNQRLIQSKKHLKDQNDQCNPQKQSTCFGLKEKDQESKIIYLQQVLLTKQQLKFTDLNLILQLTDKQSTGNKKKNVIDIDKKILNIKLSSMYVQTFSATDHNEQTRLNREYIQILKSSLKNKFQQNRSSANNLDKRILPKIQYINFLQEQIYLPFKQLFISLLYVRVLENQK